VALVAHLDRRDGRLRGEGSSASGTLMPTPVPAPSLDVTQPGCRDGGGREEHA
jgi:hypothetical protein